MAVLRSENTGSTCNQPRWLVQFKHRKTYRLFKKHSIV